MSVSKVAQSASSGHRLVGVVQSDGMPLILPVDVRDIDATGLGLAVASALMPDGARRAGFLAHDFRPGTVGLWAATHTGWLRTDPAPVWTPHSRHAFSAPPNKTLLLLFSGLAARWGYRREMRRRRMEGDPQWRPD